MDGSPAGAAVLVCWKSVTHVSIHVLPMSLVCTQSRGLMGGFMANSKKGIRGQVSAFGGHSKEDSMASVSDWRSLCEVPCWRLINLPRKHWLPCWFSAAKCVEADLFFIKLHFGSDEPIGPVWTDFVGVSQEADASLAISASKEDCFSFECLQVHFPICGEGSA